MSKRSVTEQGHATGQAYKKASTSTVKREHADPEEMGEFEDAWEDEIESDKEVHSDEDEESKGGHDPDAMDVDTEVLPAIEESDELPPSSELYLPGRHILAKDEILEPDDSVYIMRHNMNVTWPCLSFDVLRDNLGIERQRYPATAYLVSGTQADISSNNELSVYKMSALHRTQKDEDASDEEEDEDDENDLDEDPILEHRSIRHPGGVNRIRAQPLPASQLLGPVSQPYFAATLADTGSFHIWDIRPLIESLDVPGYVYEKAQVHSSVFTGTSHGRAEGFAMDWASSEGNLSSVRLLTGDVQSKIYLTTSSPSGFKTLGQPFTSHTSSVEDIQWSPSEPTVFASCSADQSVQIWDVRIKGRKSVTGIDQAHDADVNVISWNKQTKYLLLSGGDEGGIKAWDLRNIKKRGAADEQPSPAASFTWHKAPITSVEWHPTEDSIFAASGADDQVTLWDLAVEHDEEQSGIGADIQTDIPAQLLFVHQGQRDVKEVHWHPQIPGAVISTALDGFNIFKTISV